MDHVVDKLVGQDGSTYIGTTRNGLPSGLGTCLWPDGSQYDGEWREGTMNGFGTYVWRSGQRYDGEWKDGLRDGIGIKTYADGSMYDGFWKDGKKHGLGVFRPAADEPNSRRHSQGWPSQPPAAAAAAASATAAAAAAAGGGPEVADSGPPSPDPFARASLQQQQQQQQQQQEREAHSNRGAEEASDLEPPVELHRTLSDQPQQPSCLMPAAAVAAAAASPELAALRRTVAPMHPVPSNGSLANADSVPPAAAAAANVAAGAGPAKAPPAAGALGPAVSAAAAGGNTGAPLRLFVREYDLGTLMRQDALSAEEIRMIFGFLWSKKPNKVRRRVQRVLGRAPRMQKKLGEVVYKGHYSWELMIALQLGIRYSVGRPEHMSRPSTALKGSITATSSSRDAPAAPAAAPAAPGTAGGVALVGGGPAGPPLPVPAFSAAVKFAFPSCGSSTTPAHPSKDFKWKDYAPGVFKRLRSAFAVDEAEYMLSLGGSTALRQLNSPGKSGSMFFLSEDERYLVKTMRKSEMKVLLEMLPKYYEHVTKYPQTLITRFFGLHRVTPTHAGSSVRFVVMSNIFPMDLLIHRRYDIKGSTEGRTVGNAAKVEGDPNVILKDLDIDMRLQLDGSSYHSLMSQLTADCQLLREVGVMDYSLLLGVHYPSRGPVQRSLADHGMSSDGGYDYHTAPASNHAARLLRATTSDDDSQSEGGGGGGGASRFSAAASAVASALGAPAAAAGPPSAAASQAPTDPLAATLLLTSAVAVGSPTHQQQQQQQQQAGSGLKPQLSSGAGAPAVQLAGPLESLPETQVVFAPHDSATASAAAGGVGTGTQELRVHRVTTDGEGGSTGMGQGARNWDVYTGQAELEERLGKILERMRKMNFSEQRMKDIAELARLKILGSKLKKSTARREPPSAVLQAIQQQRQEYQGSGSGAGPSGSTAGGVASGDGSSMAGLPLLQTQRTLMHLKSLRGAFTGLQDEEEEEGQAETPLAGAGSQELLPKVPSAPQPQLGINMPALAVPNGAPDKAEEVIVCFGIIDILQDYSARKLVERRVKTLTHDGDAVSVAPPKKYSKRFFDFVKEHVFAPPQAQAGGSSSAPTSTGGAPATVEAAAAAGAAPVAATPAVKEATAAPGAALRLPVAAQAAPGTAGTRVLSAGGVAAAATAAAGAAADANGLSPTMSAASSATGSGSPTSQQMPIALVVSGPAAGKEAIAGVPAAAAGAAPAAPTAAVQHPRQT